MGEIIKEDIEREHLEKTKIKKIFINGERIYLKRNFLGWSVIHPIRPDGKLNWKNLIDGGSWIKLGIVIFLVLVILGCIKEYATIVRVANECLATNQIFNLGLK